MFSPIIIQIKQEVTVSHDPPPAPFVVMRPPRQTQPIPSGLIATAPEVSFDATFSSQNNTDDVTAGSRHTMYTIAAETIDGAIPIDVIPPMPPSTAASLPTMPPGRIITMPPLHHIDDWLTVAREI
ncbi:hypothetical protein NM688_g2157 [Phlebia brevispora]|uniref:Uncharacterized protein n=1 Tax=Phlebia brevispora TaxID=194682 RepID=A0ACC1T9A1_9APHY|nr:hypothetical protein NM688_g2157 [Phlebia brevispora]